MVLRCFVVGMLVLPDVLMRNQILTSDSLRCRGFQLAGRGSLCQRDDKEVDHMFLRGPFTVRVWDYSIQVGKLSASDFCTMRDLFFKWKDMQCLTRRGRVLWSLLRHAIIWIIWEERILRVFEEKNRVNRGGYSEHKKSYIELGYAKS